MTAPTSSRRKRDARHPLARLADKGAGNTPLRRAHPGAEYRAWEAPRVTGRKRSAVDAALSAFRVQRTRTTQAPPSPQKKGKGRFRDKLRGITQRIPGRRG